MAATNIDPRAMRYGEKACEKLFAGRTGHGGGPCSSRVLDRAHITALCALAFQAGLDAKP